MTKRMIISADLILPMDMVLRDEIIDLYPNVSGKVFTFKEFIFDERCPDLNIGDPMALPEIDKNTGAWVWPEGFSADYIGEIERCLTEGMEKFLKYINT